MYICMLLSNSRHEQVITTKTRKCRNWQTSKTKDLVAIAVVWVQVPSSAFKMSVINKAEMPCLSHFFCFGVFKKQCKNVYTFLHSFVGLYIQCFFQFVTFLLVRVSRETIVLDVGLNIFVSAELHSIFQIDIRIVCNLGEIVGMLFTLIRKRIL